MKTSTAIIRAARSRRGISIAEVLISLALMGMLLGSVALAVKGSLMSYDDNDDVSAITQTARSTLSRMSTDIRTSEETQVNSPTKVTVWPVVTPANTVTIVYEYTNGTLTYTKNVNGQIVAGFPVNLIDSTDKVVLSGFSATGTMGTCKNAVGQDVPCTAAVKLVLTFQTGNKTFSVTASADPRRNQTY